MYNEARTALVNLITPKVEGSRRIIGAGGSGLLGNKGWFRGY